MTDKGVITILEGVETLQSLTLTEVEGKAFLLSGQCSPGNFTDRKRIPFYRSFE